MVMYFLAAAAAIAAVLIAGRLARRGQHDTSPEGATSSHSAAMISAMFLLAFAVAIVVPWTNADAARLNTYAEAQAVHDAYWAAERLPDPTGDRAQRALTGYARFVLDSEWPLMVDHRRLGQDGGARLDRIRRDVIALPVDDGDEGEEIMDARAEFLAHISEVSAARHQRAMDARTAPPTWLLILTTATGAIVVLFPFLAGARPRGMALVPLALMAALMAIGVYLAIDISHPFEGALAVQPAAFTGLLDELHRIAASGS